MKALLPMAVLLAVSSPLWAEAPMTGAEFDAYTRGKTFFYAENGHPYGGEEYLHNRRVRWSFLGDECKDGYWYQSDELICFVYEDFDGPQCWSFVLQQEGLKATFHGNDGLTELYEVRKTTEPLNCPGPDVGV